MYIMLLLFVNRVRKWNKSMSNSYLPSCADTVQFSLLCSHFNEPISISSEDGLSINRSLASQPDFDSSFNIISMLNNTQQFSSG